MAEDKSKWLKQWLQLPFYREKCTVPKHKKQYPKVYCIDCMEPLVCPSCLEKEKKKKNDHIGLYQHWKSSNCEVCNGRLKDPGYKFCSIACKVSKDIDAIVKKDDEKIVMSKCPSFRNKSRKGIPIGAPHQ